MLECLNNLKNQIRESNRKYKESGNGVFKNDVRMSYGEYKQMGGKETLKEILKWR